MLTFEHLAETYFSGFDYDLGERELGYLTAFDVDLDIFAASIGMTKTSITTLVQDDGVFLP
jgi:dynactin 1